MKDDATLLDDVHRFLGRFVAYPSSHAHVAHALWIVHTHAMDAWESTPRICFLSPEPESGKTRALEVSELVVPNAVEAINVTPAYLFRKVGGAEPPTLLYDEIDTVFGPRAKENEEIRGLLNAGHRRGAVAGRCVVRGKVVETEEISAYCAVALAGLGWLPDTILSRAVIIRMRRRAAGERIEPFRRRLLVEVGHALRDRIAIWAVNNFDALRDARPSMPGIEDRKADVWESLLAIADLAGGNWPKLAREAALALIKAASEREPSLGIRLLADLKTVFGAEDGLHTTTILERLHVLPEAPWNDLKGKPLNDRGMSKRLGEYSVRSAQVKLSGVNKHGYRRADLEDAWRRYLPRPSPAADATGATNATNGGQVAVSEGSVADEVADDGPKNDSDDNAVAAVAAVALLPEAEADEVAFEVSRGATRSATSATTATVCAQCNADDGQLWATGTADGSILLHPECTPFWLREHPQPRGRIICAVHITVLAEQAWRTPRVAEVRPGISAGPDDDLRDIEPGWRQ